MLLRLRALLRLERPVEEGRREEEEDASQKEKGEGESERSRERDEEGDEHEDEEGEEGWRRGGGREEAGGQLDGVTRRGGRGGVGLRRGRGWEVVSQSRT